MGKGMMGRGAEGSGSATTPARHFAEPEALRMAAEFHTTFQCPVLQVLLLYLSAKLACNYGHTARRAAWQLNR